MDWEKLKFKKTLSLEKELLENIAKNYKTRKTAKIHNIDFRKMGKAT